MNLAPRNPTSFKVFNLSTKKSDKEDRHSSWRSEQSPRFDTTVDKITKNQIWPSSPQGKNKIKRRSQSQKFERESHQDGHQGYRVTFTSKPGRGMSVPMRTTHRADFRCVQCHGNLETIQERNNPQVIPFLTFK